MKKPCSVLFYSCAVLLFVLMDDVACPCEAASISAGNSCVCMCSQSVSVSAVVPCRTTILAKIIVGSQHRRVDNLRSVTNRLPCVLACHDGDDYSLAQIVTYFLDNNCGRYGI